MNISIIGGGPAGLTAAYQLAKKGHAVEVYEAGNAVGGMAKSVELLGQTVDLGPHRFFSSDPRVNALWLEACGHQYSMVSRKTRIYYKGKFYSYPLKPVEAMLKLGPIEAFRCIVSYLFRRRQPEVSLRSFEDWVVNRFGRRLFEIFFKDYSEKLWGISCKELDSDFAAQRIKKFSLAEALKAAVSPLHAAKHKTLVDEFAYPIQGAGAPYERMASEIERMGGRIHLRTGVKSVNVAGGRVTGITRADGLGIECDHVVSTMPLTALVTGLDAPPSVIKETRALRFRNTILVFLKITKQGLFPDQWLYINSSDLETGRITNFSNWVPEIGPFDGSTVLCLEYWCNNDDQKWASSDESLIATAKNDIVRSRLVHADDVADGSVIRVPRCYPIYSIGYLDSLRVIQDYLNGIANLHVIGRYGSFKYNNQDHSILMGILAAENITGQAKNDLWAVNTDYEYQEKTRITKTGLVPT